MFIVFLTITIGAPAIAVVLEFVLDSGLSERHHSHHDTYGMSIVMMGVFVMAMAFMGILGVVLTWLCMMGVFRADVMVLLGFFSSFVFVMFVMWLSMRRYHVSTYDDHLEVKPFVGRTRIIPYDKIERLRWTGSRALGGTRSVSVIVDGNVAAVLVGAINVEQIVQRINRGEVEEGE